MSIAVLAQALPSASSGMDWLYQFTNNLTNLTTQNGGALTQFGWTELSCISLFTLVNMVINWNTSTMTFRLHHHPVRAGDLTHFLLKLIVCSLLLNYWVNPFPGASFGINHFFSYIAQAMVAAFDQHSLDQLLQLNPLSVGPFCNILSRKLALRIFLPLPLSRFINVYATRPTNQTCCAKFLQIIHLGLHFCCFAPIVNRHTMLMLSNTCI